MMKENNDLKVKELLSKTRVEIAPETFSLVGLRNEDWLKMLETPELSPRMTAPFMIFKDRWEVTLLVDEIDFEAMRVALREAKIERGFRLLSFAVELDFSVVGFLAFIAEKLAEAGISIVAVSAFSRDHLLIKQADLAKTLKVLGEYVEELC
jgi:uncharacterized protein